MEGKSILSFILFAIAVIAGIFIKGKFDNWRKNGCR